EHGWKRDGRQFLGSYQTRFGSYTGAIEDRTFGDICFLIHHPPAELRNSGHWPCFQDKGEGWYAVHMRIPPEDVSSGIICSVICNRSIAQLRCSTQLKAT